MGRDLKTLWVSHPVTEQTFSREGVGGTGQSPGFYLTHKYANHAMQMCANVQSSSKRTHALKHLFPESTQ